MRSVCLSDQVSIVSLMCSVTPPAVCLKGLSEFTEEETALGFTGSEGAGVGVGGGHQTKNTQYFTIYPSSVRGGNRRLGLPVHTGAHHFFSSFHVLAYFRMSSRMGRFARVQKLFITERVFFFVVFFSVCYSETRIGLWVFTCPAV